MGYVKRNRYADSEQHLRRILRDTRMSKGLKQEELAEMLKVPQSFVSKYESGERMLTFVETVSICLAMNITPDTLLKEYLLHHET